VQDLLQYHILKKEDFDPFIARLAKLQTLVGPVAKGHGTFAFEPVQAAGDIAVQYVPTILPPKKYFLPPRETLLEFDGHRQLQVEAQGDAAPLTVFGVHTCDIAGIQCLNMVFSERPRDYNYLLRKRKITIIGLECNAYCDASASCALVGAHLPSGGYDLFFTDIGEHFLVHVNTQAGDDIVDAVKVLTPAAERHLDALAELREKKRGAFRNEVAVDPRRIPALFERSLENPVWQDLEARCLACGNCTMVCPTCYCFDVRDEVRLDPATGRRFRVWESCQSEPFALVAGGENFRKSRASRQRHRYFRKFHYPVAKYHRFFCTGCGRCSRTCMAGIKLKETLNALAWGQEGR
jgi:sulfhydrogenase subunit beta (sulfur reductase)